MGRGALHPSLLDLLLVASFAGARPEAARSSAMAEVKGVPSVIFKKVPDPLKK